MIHIVQLIRYVMAFSSTESNPFQLTSSSGRFLSASGSDLSLLPERSRGFSTTQKCTTPGCSESIMSVASDISQNNLSMTMLSDNSYNIRSDLNGKKVCLTDVLGNLKMSVCDGGINQTFTKEETEEENDSKYYHQEYLEAFDRITRPKFKKLTVTEHSTKEIPVTVNKIVPVTEYKTVPTTTKETHMVPTSFKNSYFEKDTLEDVLDESEGKKSYPNSPTTNKRYPSSNRPDYSTADYSHGFTMNRTHNHGPGEGLVSGDYTAPWALRNSLSSGQSVANPFIGGTNSLYQEQRELEEIEDELDRTTGRTMKVSVTKTTTQ